jgi:hypothetical protein
MNNKGVFPTWLVLGLIAIVILSLVIFSVGRPLIDQIFGTNLSIQPEDKEFKPYIIPTDNTTATRRSG